MYPANDSISTALPSYHERTYSQRLPQDIATQFSSINSPYRKNVESYIAKRFFDQYHATVTDFLPWILSLSMAEQFGAAVGLQPANKGSLFLEQYLPHPVENHISAHFQQPIDRNHIVEIGNLVATRSGSSYLLFAAMTWVLHHAGFQWLIFTATEQVKKIIEKLHFIPVPLCDADPSRLLNGSRQWGNYYESNPQVLAGELGKAYELLMASDVLLALLAPHQQALREYAKLIRGVRCDG